VDQGERESLARRTARREEEAEAGEEVEEVIGVIDQDMCGVAGPDEVMRKEDRLSPVRTVEMKPRTEDEVEAEAEADEVDQEDVEFAVDTVVGSVVAEASVVAEELSAEGVEVFVAEDVAVKAQLEAQKGEKAAPKFSTSPKNLDED